MNFQLVTEAPMWMLVFCPLAGFLYAWLLYRRETTFSGVDRWLVWLMSAFRFLAVSFLVLLLLSPLIKTLFTKVERPIVIFLQDNSQSILTVNDTSQVKTKYTTEVDAMLKGLEKDFDVRTFSIGEKFTENVPFTFNERISDLSEPVTELRSRFSGRNLGAVILSSDGIFNKGVNPLYSYPELMVPVFTIGMGDTTIRKDLFISRINHNKTAFSGNTFPVEITLDARQCQGKDVRLSILLKDKEVFSKAVTIPTERYNTLIPAFLESGPKGMNHYVVKVTELDGEINHVNNQRDFFVEIIDSRQQVIIIANAPHPDIAVIKGLLETNPNYEVKAFLANEFSGSLAETDLVILHQLPSLNTPASDLIKKLNEQNIPSLFILGSQTNVSGFNKLDLGLNINEHNGTATEVFAEPVNDFSYFTMDEEYSRRIKGFPPLISPFGNYQITGAAQSLLKQRIGSVKTEMPLLIFGNSGEQKTAILTGEGIWKWKLREFSEFNTSESVTTLLTKTVQYLSSREKKTPFRVYFKNSYDENEPVTMDADFYNETGELVNTNEATITIVDENKNKYPFTFSRSGNSYTLQAGYLPVGSYSFTATMRSGNKSFTETGNFTIMALQAELTETVADHQVMTALSEKTGGRFYFPSQLNKLVEDIKAKEDIKSVSFTQKRLDEIINLKVVFSAIMLLLGAEWFMRKRSGGY